MYERAAARVHGRPGGGVVQVRVSAFYVSGQITTEDLQEYVERWLADGWTISHYSTAVDSVGGVLHSFIWQKDK